MNNNIKKILASSTLSEMFQTRVQLSPKETAYHYFANDQWQDKTWEGIAEDSVVWQQIFKKLGLQTNDKVSIMLKNCHEWVAFDQAALGLGLVTVPLFFNDNADNASYILQESYSILLHSINLNVMMPASIHLMIFGILRKIICHKTLLAMPINSPQLFIPLAQQVARKA